MTLPELAGEKYFYLTTTGRVTGEPRTVELWFVVYGDKLYAVSGMGTNANWVRNVIRQPEVTIRVRNIRMEARARVLERTEQPLWDAVSRSACEKYREPEPWGTPVEFAVMLP
jgi:deazaflavin-dependent oxidoreductase (nitroreductase family)